MQSPDDKVLFCEKVLGYELAPWQKDFLRHLDAIREERRQRERAFFIGVDLAREPDKASIARIEYSGETPRILWIDEYDSIIHKQSLFKRILRRLRAFLNRAAEKIWGWAE